MWNFGSVKSKGMWFMMKEKEISGVLVSLLQSLPWY